MHETMHTTHLDVAGTVETVVVTAHRMVGAVETGTPAEDEVDSTAGSTATVPTLV